jgi:hypothetical protein
MKTSFGVKLSGRVLAWYAQGPMPWTQSLAGKTKKRFLFFSLSLVLGIEFGTSYKLTISSATCYIPT